MAIGEKVSDLVIPNINTKYFFEELVLNCPSLAGQIVSRKPEYASIIEEIVENHVMSQSTGRHEKGIRYLQMGLINKFIDCFEGPGMYERMVEDYKKLAETYGKSKEWDYVSPDKLTKSALEEINNPYRRLNPFSGGDNYAIFFEKFD